MFENCHHLCSSALKENVLCRCKEDYIVLWNTLLIASYVAEVKVYSLCLMSNHFHILLSGSGGQIETLVKTFKQMAGKYQMERYSSSVIGGLKFQTFPIPDRRAFCREVAYILRNPYASRIANPFSYRWSSADAYFSCRPEASSPIGNLSLRKQRALFHTHRAMPSDWRIESDGRIMPASVVDREYVERMFDNSSVGFFDLIRRWNLEDIVNESHGEEIVCAFSDDEVIKGIHNMCKDIFAVEKPQMLDRKSLATLVRKVYNRFGCPRAQLLRLLPVDNYFLDKLL